MAVVVIGGHSRNVGKTSVVAGVIAALREWQWTAVKITQHGHGICSRHDTSCDCIVDDQTRSFAINDEHDRSGGSDTSRFLLAGAERSLWVRTRQGHLAEAMPDLRRLLEGDGNIIFESNSILQFIRPDLYFIVLDFANPDFKHSAQQFLDRADAVILHHAPACSHVVEPKWADVSPSSLASKPLFRVCPPEYVTPEIVQFITARLAFV